MHTNASPEKQCTPYKQPLTRRRRKGTFWVKKCSISWSGWWIYKYINHCENKLLLKLKKKWTHGTYQNSRKSVWPVSQEILWWEMEWQCITPKHREVSSSVGTTGPFACKRKAINRSKVVDAILLQFINNISKITKIHTSFPTRKLPVIRMVSHLLLLTILGSLLIWS